MDDVVKEFLIESYENLDQLDRDIVVLEHNPNDRAILSSIFRTIHTIKGTCGFLGYSKLETLTHVGEGLLHRLRDGDLAFTSEIGSALLEMVDGVREILTAIESGGNEGDGDYSAIVESLSRLHGRRITDLREPARDPRPAEERSTALAENSVRVDVTLLDKLMNLVGELVLARNQILQMPAVRESAVLSRASQRLNLITTELQEKIMKTRMQPIGKVWSKIPRLVRDLAIACGKSVRVEMEGGGTELDRSLLEAIKDPLTHLVRNAIDHGIEPPADRAARGKPAEGRLLIQAYHENGQVTIDVSDDGEGVEIERVKRKAVEIGALSPEQAARMSDRDALSLIFMPGFSTATKVTSVSGRGVGMDVVRTNIEKIGGTVEATSSPRQGTRIRLKIPLTLAIIPALIVVSRGARYAIPQVSLMELVRLEGDQARARIERIHAAPVYRLRGGLLPLVFLSHELEPGRAGSSEGPPPDALNIAVLLAEDRQFGLVVDDVCDTQEIVVKPLGKHLKGIPVFAGATILGDGKIALILDVLGLAQRANVLGEAQEHPAGCEAITSKEQVEERQTVLLVELPGGGRVALPLSAVARLEEIPRASVERAGGIEVVQYRDRILPLIRLSLILGENALDPAPDERDQLQVVVYADGNRSAGIVVDRIVDIVEEPLRIQLRASRDGSLGSAVIQQRVTEVIDPERILRCAASQIVEALEPVSVGV